MSKQVRLLNVEGYAPGTIAVTNDEAADAWVAAGKAEYTNQADAPKAVKQKKVEIRAESPVIKNAAFAPAETADVKIEAPKKRGPGRPKKSEQGED